MKIAMLGHKRIPSREGGIEVVVEELSTRMVQRGHQVTCFCRSGHHVSGKQFDTSTLSLYKGVRLRTVWTIDVKGLAALTSSFSATIKAGLSKADIVHVHAEGPAAMCWLLKLFGKKVVVTVHGLDWEREKWGGLASKYIKYGEKQAVRHADGIIVLSRRIQKYFHDRYGRKTEYIPNGIGKSNPKAAEIIKEKWGFDKDDYVLFLGRIVPEKGLEYLLSAWKRLDTDKKLVIVGGSSDSSEYMNEIKNEKAENVVFTGFQQGEVLDELYSNCYVFCLPSDLEGMSMSLLEALSYGCCCVVSDIPECTEVVGDNAVIFKHSDVEDLSIKLQSLLNDKRKVENYRKKTSMYIMDKYKWDDTVNMTLELYSQILKGEKT